MRTFLIKTNRRALVRRVVLGLAVAGGLGVATEWVAKAAFSRSVWMKLLPVGPFERIELIGSAASGTVLDGQGGWFNGGRPTEILIQSRETEGGWDCPEDIVIRNGRLRGRIRVIGMGRNGQSRPVRLSSYRENHTARAQAAAPAHILISNVQIVARGRIPIYLSPGATDITIENCAFRGWSSSVAIYLDAESGRNVIRNNTFASRVSREVIAVDGSAGNRIENNCFERFSLGGIYLYRNCGEGGTVRHQAPQDNIIAGNRFAAAALGWRAYGIWLGSRNGRRLYCETDAGYPFGSSANNRDFANNNTVTNNVFVPQVSRTLRDDGKNNRIASEGE
jgi:hypothetical protein